VLVAEGLATREPNRGVSVSCPERESVHDVCVARLVLEGAGIRRWQEADEAQRALVHDTLEAYIAATRADASYQELNERHLAFHVSLVGLTGSPRLVAMQENLVVELKLALAQVDRVRRNAHDMADSHAALVRLLDDGDIDGAHAFLVDHLADAEDQIIEALDLRNAST
jgi:DNA-binding GntR family transcriptional regulator